MWTMAQTTTILTGKIPRDAREGASVAVSFPRGAAVPCHKAGPRLGTFRFFQSTTAFKGLQDLRDEDQDGDDDDDDDDGNNEDDGGDDDDDALH